MVTSFTKPVFPHDIAFTNRAGELERARSSVDARPTDYSRRGGAALQSRGDMYTALAKAAMDAAADRRSSDMDRSIAWNQASRRKEAMAREMEARNVANAATGLLSLGKQFGRGVSESAESLGFTGKKAKADFGDDFDKLLEQKMIQEITKPAPAGTVVGSPGWRESALYPKRGVVGTGEYRYTPKFMLQPKTVGEVLGKMHEGPYWWEGEGSTGGWGK